MKRLISSDKNSVAINSNELINISDISVYQDPHFISCSEHLNPNSLSQLRWHSGAALIGQYFCNRRWLAAAAATLLTRLWWKKEGEEICYGNLVLVASCNTSILKYPLPYWHFARLKVLLYSSLTSRASVFSRTKLKVLQRIYSVIRISFVLIISWLIATLGPDLSQVLAEE